MNTEEFIFAVIDFLNEYDVPYMVVGSLATNFYCVPRSTQDADIVVAANIASLATQIGKRHAGIRFDPQIEFESVTATQNLILTTESHQFEIELFTLGSEAHDQQRFARRVAVQLLGRTVWIAFLEDMIITKFRWPQEADVSDVRNLIAVQGEHIDWPYVESWCDRHNTRALLERLRSESSAD